MGEADLDDEIETWSREQIEAAEALLDAGYDNGFGVTSLDTLLCEQMQRAERVDFAAFLVREILQKNGSQGE